MSAPEYPPITPNFAVLDVQESIAWFEKLGFESLGTANAPDGTIMHAELSRGQARVMLGPAMGAVGAPGLELYIKLEDGIDLYCDAVKTRGVTLAEELHDEFWGDRTFKVKHPDGYVIMFAQSVRDVTMDEIESHYTESEPATV